MLRGAIGLAWRALLAIVLCALLAAPGTSAAQTVTAGLTWVGGSADQVGATRAGADGVQDAAFDLNIQVGSGPVGIRLIELFLLDAQGRHCCGRIWSSGNNNYLLLGVAPGGGPIRNPTFVATLIELATSQTLRLHANDAGAFQAGQTFEAVISLSTGEIVRARAMTAPAQAQADITGEWMLPSNQIVTINRTGGNTIEMTHPQFVQASGRIVVNGTYIGDAIELTFNLPPPANQRIQDRGRVTQAENGRATRIELVTTGVLTRPAVPSPAGAFAGRWVFEGVSTSLVYEMSDTATGFTWLRSGEVGTGTRQGAGYHVSWTGGGGSGAANGRVLQSDAAGRVTRFELIGHGVMVRLGDTTPPATQQPSADRLPPHDSAASATLGFSGVTGDLVAGAGPPGRDGVPDGQFPLTLNLPAQAVIRQIDLYTVQGDVLCCGQRWSTADANSYLLGAVTPDGQLFNRYGPVRELATAPAGQVAMILVANNTGFFRNGQQVAAVVTFGDGRRAVARLTLGGSSPAVADAPPPTLFAGRWALEGRTGALPYEFVDTRLGFDWRRTDGEIGTAARTGDGYSVGWRGPNGSGGGAGRVVQTDASGRPLRFEINTLGVLVRLDASGQPMSSGQPSAPAGPPAPAPAGVFAGSWVFEGIPNSMTYVMSDTATGFTWVRGDEIGQGTRQGAGYGVNWNGPGGYGAASGRILQADAAGRAIRFELIGHGVMVRTGGGATADAPSSPPAAPAAPSGRFTGRWTLEGASGGPVYEVTDSGSGFTWWNANMRERGEGVADNAGYRVSWSGPYGNGAAPGRVLQTDAAGRVTRFSLEGRGVMVRADAVTAQQPPPPPPQAPSSPAPNAADGFPLPPNTSGAQAALSFSGLSGDIMAGVGPPGRDGVQDGQFVLQLRLPAAAVIRQIDLVTIQGDRWCCGQFWSTAMNQYWLLGVATPDGRLFNRSGYLPQLASLNAGDTTMLLVANDSGWFRNGQAYAAVITFADGRHAVARATIGGAPPAAPQTQACSPASNVWRDMHSSGWRGTWTRQQGNVFSTVYELGAARQEGFVTIDFLPNGQVRLSRSGPYVAVLMGQLDADGRVRGRYPEGSTFELTCSAG